MTKSAFVTGIAGLLGSHIAAHLLKQGWQVSGIDNFVGGDPENVPEGARCVIGDIQELYYRSDLLQGVDVVYHCAAQAHEGASVFAPYTICHNIFSGTASVVSAVAQTGVKRLVNCSSMARYGAQPSPFTEDMPCTPVDPYGIAKRAAEDLIANQAAVHGFEYVHAVPHNIYGPNQCYIDAQRNVMAIMINMLLQDRRPIIYGDGEQTRCFSYIDDCVEPMLKMATDPRVIGQAINIGPDTGTISMNDMCRLLIKIMGKKIEPIHIDPRPCEVAHASCSADKARKLLGYQPKTSLEDGMAKLIDWIRDKGTRKFVYPVKLEIISDKTPKTWSDRLF